MKRAKILLANEDPQSDLGGQLRNILESASHMDVQTWEESSDADKPGLCDRALASLMASFQPQLVFLIISTRLRKEVGRLFQAIKKERSQIPLVLVLEPGEPAEMFELLKLGAADFIVPPLRPTDILPRVWRLLEQTRQRETVTYLLKEELGLSQLIGKSPSFLAETKKIPLIAQCDASVLIAGETGTGKELCARAIHYLSPRASKPFIPVNCGAIPTELVENELFGHARGAFTGAVTSQRGLIHEANGSTLFLDEIDCLPLSAQVKLLRFLQEKEFRLIGSTKMQQVDVRVISATNVNLNVAMKEEKFRRDLYYRLNIIPLDLPPLRERRDDILSLARHFLAKYADKFKKLVSDFTGDAARKLLFYDWPGNVRELEHIIQRSVVLCERTVIHSDDILLPDVKATARSESFREAKARALSEFERNYVQCTLVAHQGNVTKAAQAARKDRRSFSRLIRKYQIDVKGIRLSAPQTGGRDLHILGQNYPTNTSSN